MSGARLGTIGEIVPDVARPRFDPANHAGGTVHIGIGAFHRAHQAAFTDTALAAEGGDWRIRGVSLRSTDIADALNRQNGLYTLLERGRAGTSARVIASIERVIAGRRAPGAVLAALADPATRIVSLTVTEKAYRIDRAIAGGKADPQSRAGVIGLRAQSLRRRRDAGVSPFTVLCCDNLPNNGGLVRARALEFTGSVDPNLRDWIAQTVAFPSTMVDRITPASTSQTIADAEKLTGLADLAAVETEPFCQWIIEENFTDGRPAWEAGGALFVEKVAPYEEMKLRMLNGTHSLIAYVGFLSGCRCVRDAMGHPLLTQLVDRHLIAAAATLDPLDGIDFSVYGRALADRFANPAIAHETYQIAMDGTEKLPQRLLMPALHVLDSGRDVRPFAFAIAAWMRYCLGRTDSGEKYALRDPQEEKISAALRQTGGDPKAILDVLHALPGLFPKRLRENRIWKSQVGVALSTMLEKGMECAIADEARLSDMR